MADTDRQTRKDSQAKTDRQALTDRQTQTVDRHRQTGTRKNGQKHTSVL